MKIRRFFFAGTLALALILSAFGGYLAAKEKFPTKPIQVVIGFQPGDTDNLLRPFTEKMPEHLGQPVVFQYKPGASGTLGAALVASAKPDGYTLLANTVALLTIHPHTRDDVSYSLQSFVPISAVVEVFAVISTQKNAPWKNLAELVADAKKSPGKISYSTPGTFSLPHLLTEAFCDEAGIQLTHIPSQGSGPAVTATLGGHVNLGITALAPAFPHLMAGSLRPLAVMSEKRVPALPNVPTMLEAGYSTSSTAGYYGFVAPRGTPQEVVEKIFSATKKVAEGHKETIVDRLSKFGALLSFKGPEEYRAILKKQNEIFGNLIRKIKSK